MTTEKQTDLECKPVTKEQDFVILFSEGIATDGPQRVALCNINRILKLQKFDMTYIILAMGPLRCCKSLNVSFYHIIRSRNELIWSVEHLVQI